MVKGPVSHSCACSAKDYWSLRLHDGNAFDRFRAAADSSRHEVISMEEDAQGCACSQNRLLPHLTHCNRTHQPLGTRCPADIKRVSKVTANQNPIPSSMRKMLGLGDDFSFRITESWWRDKYDADHPLTMATVPAVMADKIIVTGSEWVEPTGEASCKIFFKLSVKVGGRPTAAAAQRRPAQKKRAVLHACAEGRERRAHRRRGRTALRTLAAHSPPTPRYASRR